MNTTLLSPSELEAMSARMGANADNWLAARLKPDRQTVVKLIRRPAKTIVNPFAGYLMQLDDFNRPYPLFAMDIIEGIARLDWHGRGNGVGGISKPLSVRRIISILEWLPEITNEAVERFLSLGERHASRYVKAVELAIPRMINSRPDSLRWEMEGVLPPPPNGSSEWEDLDGLRKPSAEELAQLHHDMRTFTEYATAEEYEAETDNMVVHTTATFKVKKGHPKRVEVMELLGQGLSQVAIERTTGVPRKTIRRWQAETLTKAAW
jgi:hypothetical protein